MKDELYEQTAGWRSENVGPVYRFAPLDPENSHCFNPLTFVRGERRYVMEDAKVLADLMMIQDAKAGGESSFWDASAARMLQMMIAHTCFEIEPGARSMNTLHALANGVGWNEFVASLCVTDEIAAMQEEGASLMKINEKTLDGYLQTLKRTLQPWAGESVREVTRRSDWKPLDLRSATPPTLYICLKAHQMSSFSSVMRVLLGLHLQALLDNKPADRKNIPPILFMLDELPQLGHMPMIPTGVDVGRSVGLRLWLIAQRVEQITAAYPNHKGLVGACEVEAYMNPSGGDGAAERISKRLGFREGAIDGQRRLIVEPQELAGPDYKDDIIIFGASSKPARATKVMAHEHAFFNERLDLPIKDAPKQIS